MLCIKFICFKFVSDNNKVIYLKGKTMKQIKKVIKELKKIAIAIHSIKR